MEKKGVELSVNVIIIAAISLIVLVLLAFLVIRAGGGVTKGTQCESLGGHCRIDCNQGEWFDPSKSCATEGEVIGEEKCCFGSNG